MMIEMKSIGKLYEGQAKPALEDINVKIKKGEFVFLVGPSGSGKTTFIRILLKELMPTAGKVYVADQDLSRLRSRKVPYLRRSIGCVFQDFKLLPYKTAYENVSFALEVIGRSNSTIKSLVPEALKLVGLEDKANSYPDELSGGEQQRVSVARAFVNRPPLLLADEPTGNLDPATSAELMALFSRISRTGTTVLVATHDREMVNSMRKRVIALEEGKMTRDQKRGVYGYED